MNLCEMYAFIEKKKPRPSQQKETECLVQDTIFIMDNNGVQKVE